MAWGLQSLGDVLTFQRGFDITKTEQRPGSYWVISSSGPSSKHDQFKLNGPGVIIGRKGSLGTVHFSAEAYWPHDTTLWVKNFHGNDPRFTYYFLQTMGLEKLDVGASNPTLNRNHIHLLTVRWPDDIATQRRIAAILSAYDDLIENNTRRIAILEEMARRIYEEWFVRFRFPGHEGITMVESELGLVPQGWELATVQDVMETLGGGTPSKAEDDYWIGGQINWYSPTDLTGAKTVFMGQSANKITDLGLVKSSAKLFPPMSVMMTSRATLGVIAVNTTTACTNQGFITCIPSERFPLWLLYHWLKENADVFEGFATGATFKEITKGVFRKLELAVPPIKLTKAFELAVGPMMNLILQLERKNTNLRTTRDLLLPKLISGELDVSTLPEPQAETA